MIVYVVTSCWSERLFGATKVDAVFAKEADALAYVDQQKALLANKGVSFVVWGREVQ